jgi:phospholipid-binding lipoprotein MlaA
MKKICTLIMLVLLAVFTIRVSAIAAPRENGDHSVSILAATITEENNSHFEEDDLDDIEEEQAPEVADPLESWNRMMFRFNDRVYFWVIKPACRGYGAVVPERARTGVRNFFHNGTVPIRFLNCLLQGKFRSSGNELARFIINTTVGFLGFGDPAKKYAKMEPIEEDFGQTLGTYGIHNGAYIVWPFLGPSTIRDSIGLVGDAALNPLTWIGVFVDPWQAAGGAKLYNEFNDTSLRIGEYESLIEEALEPYEAVRDAYIQYRWERVKK